MPLWVLLRTGRKLNLASGFHVLVSVCLVFFPAHPLLNPISSCFSSSFFFPPSIPTSVTPPPRRHSSSSIVGRSAVHYILLHLFPPSLFLWNVKTLVRLSWLNHPSLLSQNSSFFYRTLSFPKFSESRCSLYIPFASTTQVSDWEKNPYFLKLIAKQLMCSTFLFF